MTMTREELAEAITEAERFLSKAKPLLKESTEIDKANVRKRAEWEKSPASKERYAHFWGTPDPLVGSAQSAAVKRSSMDLTRALAALRRRA
jgi:hypothetical protein